MIRKYEKGDAQKLSENFRAREFDCPGKNCCKETLVDEALVQYLQAIRDHFGKPLYVLGYRCEDYNAKTPNASKTSRHTKGMAADINMDGVAPGEIAKYAEELGVKGIGLYDTFVHIDTRESKSFWLGHQQTYAATFGGESPLVRFVKDVQTAIGAKVDGIPGSETLDKTPTVSAYKNNRHPVVAVLQKRLYELGYTQVGEADGIAGKKFTAAVTAFQKDNGCIPDGELTAGKTTWRKILLVVS